MREKVHKIHSLPDDAPWDTPVPPPGSPEHPLTVRGIDRVLAVQRPFVVAHLRSIRLRHPHATPAEIIRILENRYLAAVTTGGAAVGATAVIPGIGTGVTLALSGVETVGFMESTALFAQSIAEVHGIAIENPDRARALVMTLMLGKEGVDLVSQLARQATGKGAARQTYWGELITKSLPRAAVGPIVDRLKTAFVHQFAARGGASFIGKALPFGIGAAVGGAGNHLLGRRVLTTSRRAFPAPPFQLPPELEPVEGTRKVEVRMLHGARSVGSAVASTAGTVARGVGAVGRRVGDAGQRAGGMLRRRPKDAIEPASEEPDDLPGPPTSAERP